MARGALSLAAVGLTLALPAASPAAREAAFFAAPGRAGGAAPTAAPLREGSAMRVGFQVPAGIAAAPPAAFRLFVEPDDAPSEGITTAEDEADCLLRVRRHLNAAGRMPGLRELGGSLLLAFGEDATVALIDPAGRGLAGLARLPGPASGFAVDPVGQRIFVASADPPTLNRLDMALRRATTTIPLAGAPRALAWDPVLERLQLLDAAGNLTALHPETLAPLATATPQVPSRTMALLVEERLLAVAGDRGLVLHDAGSLLPLATLPAATQVTHLAAAGRILFAAGRQAAYAFDAVAGRVLAQLALPAEVAGLLALGGGQVVLLTADGGASLLDAASGQVGPLATPEAGLVEAALAGGALFLRGSASPRLMVLAAGSLRPRRAATPAYADAGLAAFGGAPLPLMAALSGRMLVANPGDARIFVHMAGMAAPTAVFTTGGSRVIGFVATSRSPQRTAPARVELTAEAPPAGRWRLVAALAETGRAVCLSMQVLPGAPS